MEKQELQTLRLWNPLFPKIYRNNEWGEGFEQRPIDTPNGELYLSFWDAGNEFFIKPEEQLKNQQSQGFGMTMG